jgi:hypothetical protein
MSGFAGVDRRDLMEQPAFRRDRERDLCAHEQRLERRDLALELARVARAEERDRCRDRNGEDDRRRQLEREAQAEPHRDVRRDRQQLRGCNRTDPEEDRPVLLLPTNRILEDLPDEPGDRRERDQRLEQTDVRSAIVSRRARGLLGALSGRLLSR